MQCTAYSRKIMRKILTMHADTMDSFLFCEKLLVEFFECSLPAAAAAPELRGNPVSWWLVFYLLP